MKQLRKKFEKHSIRRKLLMAVSIFLPVLILGQMVQFFFVSQYIQNTLYTSANTVAVGIRDNLDGQLKDMVERMYSFPFDASASQNLMEVSQSQGTGIDPVTTSQLTEELTLYRATEPLITSLVLSMPNALFSSNADLMIDRIPEDTLLWQQLQQGSGNLRVLDVMKPDFFRINRNVIPVVYRFSTIGYQEDCYLIANVGQIELTYALRNCVPEDGSHAFLVTEGGDCVTTPIGAAPSALAADRETLQALLSGGEYMEREYEGQEYVIQACPLGMAPWQLVYLQSKEASVAVFYRALNLFLALSIGILLVLLVVINQFSASVTRPLYTLSQQLESGEAGSKLSYEHDDEIGTLVSSYNHMADNIQHLLQEKESYICQLQRETELVGIEQNLKRKAELRALQAQINPHFLYNTLDSIHWKAEMAGEEEISRMTTALANLFRVSLSRGREIITVQQELSHVESYLKIQKIRYKDRMTYSMEVDPQTLQLHTVKLVLQPLVENAIYHGIKESDHSGNVAIRVYCENDRLCFQVTDNGIGIPEERLRQLQRNLDKGKTNSQEGYGIFNVNERIRLYFGPQFGLRLDSNLGSGTTATLTLPCITISEVEQYVSDHDS